MWRITGFTRRFHMRTVLPPTWRLLAPVRTTNATTCRMIAQAPSALPYFIMVLSPLFFSTNLIFGRFVTGEISPFLLATMRWGAVAHTPVAAAVDQSHCDCRLVRTNWRLLAVLGFLGMGVCGGGIYLALPLHDGHQCHADLHDLAGADPAAGTAFLRDGEAIRAK